MVAGNEKGNEYHEQHLQPPLSQAPCVCSEQPGPSKSTYRASLLGLNLFQFLIEPTLCTLEVKILTDE